MNAVVSSVEEDKPSPIETFEPLTGPRPRRSSRMVKEKKGGSTRSKAANLYRETYAIAEPTKKRKDEHVRKEEGEEAAVESKKNEEDDEGKVVPMDLDEEPAVEADVEVAKSPARPQRAPATPRSAKQRSSRKEVQEAGAKAATTSKRARPSAFVSPTEEGTKKLKLNTPAGAAEGSPRKKTPATDVSNKRSQMASSPARSGSFKKTPASRKNVVVFTSPEVLQRMDPADLAVKIDFASPAAKVVSARKEQKEASSVPQSPAPTKPVSSPRKSPRIAFSPPVSEVKVMPLFSLFFVVLMILSACPISS